MGSKLWQLETEPAQVDDGTRDDIIERLGKSGALAAAEQLFDRMDDGEDVFSGARPVGDVIAEAKARAGI